MRLSAAPLNGSVKDAVSELVVPPTMKVATLVELGSPATLLLRVAAAASLLVLGGHHFNLLDRLLTGPVTSAVAAQAGCPVVVVPGAWSSTRVTSRSVVVALDGETAATATLDFAFSEAEQRRHRLHEPSLRRCGLPTTTMAAAKD